jgi:hypothetical protein
MARQILIVAVVLAAMDAAHSSTLTVPVPITVDAASFLSGPSFVLLEPADGSTLLQLIVSGTIDLASNYQGPGSQQYTTSAAGVVVGPALTHVGTGIGSVLSCCSGAN